MKRAMYWAGLAAVALAGLAVVVHAQEPPPDGGFGGRGPGRGGPMAGMFASGGLVGGFGGKLVTRKPFQASFTITRTETLPGNTIANTTTGTVARDADGSIYRDAKFPAMGPWAQSGKAQEFAYIRNVGKSEQYIVNVTKGTYKVFAIREHNPSNGGKDRANGSKSQNETVTDNPNGTYTDPITHKTYPVDDRTVTRTIPAGEIGNQFAIVITIERWYSSGLDLLLEQTHSDPRFGTSTYQLSDIGQTPEASLFLPASSFTQVEGGKLGKNMRRESSNQSPAPAQD